MAGSNRSTPLPARRCSRFKVGYRSSRPMIARRSQSSGCSTFAFGPNCPPPLGFRAGLLCRPHCVAAGVAPVMAQRGGGPHGQGAGAAVMNIGQDGVDMANYSDFLVIPPSDASEPAAWNLAGVTLLETVR